MNAPAFDLRDFAKNVRALADRAERDPLRFMRWTPPQLAFLSDQSQVKLFRGGNQSGKTWAQCGEVIYRALGCHPYLETHRVPTESWLITHSWEQSIVVQSKFWELVPKGELHPSVVFVPGKGFVGKVPVVRFRNGSIVRIKTTSQGQLGLASATLDYVGIDEPPPANIWGELSARVFRNNGVIGMTLTPVGAPVEWLRELVKDGKISDHQASLTVENTTPEGCRPMLSQEQIDDIASRYLPMDRAPRLEGAWEGVIEGRTFDAFQEDHITTRRPPSGPTYRLGIGIDHGADAGSQVAILVAVNPAGRYAEIHVVDEYVAGAADPETHATEILRMLKRNGMDYHSVDRWTGDRKYGGKRWGGRMSNARLMRGFERILGFPMGGLPFRVRSAYKPSGSIYEGCSIVQEAMMRHKFSINAKCEALIRSLRLWSYQDDGHKHAIDALRYAAVPLLNRNLYVPNTIRLG